MILSIDTSSRHGGVALCDADGTVIEARLWRSTANHTAQLMPAVAELLKAQDTQAADLDGVAVALGPGPFSALRVGVSAAKGLVMAVGFPIVGVDTLALEARPHLTPTGIVAAWLDAGRNEVAAGWFAGDGERVREDEIAPPETLLEQEPTRSESAVIYCGEGAHARLGEIPGHGNNGDAARPTAVAPWTPANRLWALAETAARRLQRGETDDLATLQPYYLRMPTIGVAKRRDRVRQGRPSVTSSQI
ncbi:MAG: tRNA (adenosine(37)-N6)-threonylcarbamoyltransferase complex dimerization subunit type 1 TsaB [Chloroflexota bacterium]|nr:tRNA (adenosine(37)-N6)-threonylcarbamoyltransferase complex dimerization subunit type 1 TsaB [Chloroflexota bacterium]MDE2685597.1 tRNA (adenosine(37)-N6)-threonylcarbamoyltransferase complex dimerization subunit type 1 TsaB [Chloroflexota bacterium]